MAYVQEDLSAMASFQSWSEWSQLYEGDNKVDRDDSEIVESLTMGLKQNKIHELVKIWQSWDQTEKDLFYQEFGDIADLLYVKMNAPLIWEMLQFWSSSYRCFNFNSNDMTLTVEEYTSLLNIPNIEVDKIYTKPTHPKGYTLKIMLTVGSDKEWDQDRGEIFVAIYSLVIFPKDLGYIEASLFGFSENLEKGINLVLAILAKTFVSLSHCRTHGGGRFIGWADMSRCHPNFAPLRDFLQNHEDLGHYGKKVWVDVLKNMRTDDIALEEEFKQVSLELQQKKNMYTTKEVKRQVDEAKRDANT
ncbi:hypothetical protein GQ457_13G018680 [Hibiscus cannabinus]